MCIRDSDKRFFIEDSNSRNGTFVNGNPVESNQRLYNNDRVRICDLEFVFLDDRTESQPPEANLAAQTMLVTMIDDERTSHSEIMSRIDLSSRDRRTVATASANVKLHAMMELSDGLAHALSVDDVLAPVIDSLFKIFLQADHGVIALLDERGEWEPRCMRLSLIHI